MNQPSPKPADKLSATRESFAQDYTAVETKDGTVQQQAGIRETTTIEEADHYPGLLEKRLETLSRRIYNLRVTRGNVTAGFNLFGAAGIGAPTIFFIAGALGPAAYAFVAGGTLLTYGAGMAINHFTAKREIEKVQKEEQSVFNRLADYMKAKSQSMAQRLQAAQPALFGQPGKQQDFNAKSAAPATPANDIAPDAAVSQKLDALRPPAPQAKA